MRHRAHYDVIAMYSEIFFSYIDDIIADASAMQGIMLLMISMQDKRVYVSDKEWLNCLRQIRDERL